MKSTVLKGNIPVATLDLDEFEYPGAELELVIGRSDGAFIKLDGRDISREHAALVWKNEQWLIVKKSDKAELFKNGSSFDSIKVENDDVIKIGSYEIQFHGEIANRVVPEENTASIKDVEEPTADISNIIDDDLIEEKKQENLDNVDVEETKTTEFEQENSDIENDEKSDEPMLEDDEFDFSNDSSEDQMGNDNTEADDMFPTALGDDGDDGFDDDESTQVFKGFAECSLELFGEFAPYDRFSLQDGDNFIGRDSSKCQIVLDDSEVSTLHAVVKKIGNQCFLEDLGSSNGTIYKGFRINKTELNNDDEFIIGSTNFAFSVGSKIVKESEEMLMPVESEEVVDVEEVVEVESDDFELGEINEGGDFSSSEEKSILKNPKKRKYLLYGIVGILLVLVLFGDDEPKKKKQVSSKINRSLVKGDVKKDKSNGDPTKISNKKLNLSSEDKETAEQEYQLARELIARGNFQQALFEIDKVVAIDPNFKNIRQYQEAARKGLSELEALERRKKEEIEKALKKEKITKLLEKAREAVKDHRVELATGLFNEIIRLDPENYEVPNLKMEINEWQKEQEAIALKKEEERIRRKGQVDALRPSETAFLRDDWYKAIAKLDEFLQIKDLDADLIEKATKMMKDSKYNLSQIVDPLLGKALSFQEGEDFKSAYETYKEVLKYDISNVKALNSMNELRDKLETRSKKVYREAIISESLSLFQDAKEKFQEVQQISPSDSDYYKLATKKLKDYLE